MSTPPSDAPAPLPIEYTPTVSDPTPSHPIAPITTTTTTVPLDALGPVVVNEDGTLSRIANWHSMTEAEQKNTLRVLGKRNQARMARLKAAEEAGEGPK
ncbi:hypothetical protein HDU96_010377 [Phlyctochytrium bullatum]|nr:hypothetical protein HDU96_010377 [Phlyctochytrium bullatum]